MTITDTAHLTDDITALTDAEGGTWTRQPGADVWRHRDVEVIGPVTSAELVDMFRPLTPVDLTTNRRSR
ncbi:hypothetical protein [Verrucosispora sp. WMMC514]|uniref:hypothetical protein n=1 Tax=Verrucosispora sp. WMMC514 TaxID=3015156 RepID=UPI00248A9059|nr:hypothetical protein [Verrucosispora sp. WMMC514]WBB94116.1 hypothetical protein O7597_14805 [Verrucosispora sp. WMMC514]